MWNRRVSVGFTFNIVYTRGTVRCLSPFAWSLVKWSDCSFRLVANGCTSEELGTLQRLCQENARFELSVLPTELPMTHGEALDHLLASSGGGSFCFMDSDILATGDFVSEAVSVCDQYAAMFCCCPAIYRKRDDEVNRYNGVDVGCTYFAIYDHRVLGDLVEDTGISFDKYRWDEVPSQYREQITAIGMQREKYDTGKLINVMLLSRGERLFMMEDGPLLHIGGVSRIAYKDEGRHLGSLGRIAARFPQGRLGRLLVRIAEDRQRKSRTRGWTAEKIAARDEKAKHKLLVNRYIAQVLDAVAADLPLPQAPRLGDAEVDSKVELATRVIVDQYREIARR